MNLLALWLICVFFFFDTLQGNDFDNIMTSDEVACCAMLQGTSYSNMGNLFHYFCKFVFVSDLGVHFESVNYGDISSVGKLCLLTICSFVHCIGLFFCHLHSSWCCQHIIQLFILLFSGVISWICTLECFGFLFHCLFREIHSSLPFAANAWQTDKTLTHRKWQNVYLRPCILFEFNWFIIWSKRHVHGH